MNPQERRNARKLREQQAAAMAAVEAAREQGREHFHTTPQDLLVAVARYAATLFPDTARQIAFLQGYCEARGQHDAFKRGE
jgi:hypothetical protein